MNESKNIIPIASDHGGFWIKEFIKTQLTDAGFEVKDLGTYSSESVDYPDFIHPLAKAVNEGVYNRGIIACGSGQGAMMTANKYPNIRAGLCWNTEQAKLIRMHNNANIISLPGRFVSLSAAWEMVHTFLTTEFEGGRHVQRVEKIGKIL
ncbi:MAG: ribose 5-phosphate isomerase B [Bacteroidales bacterium]|nr:ribose 5-phosphate isomerase B [Bacteroidales bacterium]